MVYSADTGAIEMKIQCSVRNRLVLLIFYKIDTAENHHDDKSLMTVITIFSIYCRSDISISIFLIEFLNCRCGGYHSNCILYIRTFSYIFSGALTIEVQAKLQFENCSQIWSADLYEMWGLSSSCWLHTHAWMRHDQNWTEKIKIWAK